MKTVCVNFLRNVSHYNFYSKDSLLYMDVCECTVFESIFSVNLLLISFVHYWFWLLPFSWQHILLIFRGAVLVCGWVIYSMCNVDCDCAPMFIRQTVAQFFCFVFNSWPSALHQISFWRLFSGTWLYFSFSFTGAVWVIWCITAYDEHQDISLMLGGRTQSCTSLASPHLSACWSCSRAWQAGNLLNPCITGVFSVKHAGDCLLNLACWRPWVQLSGLYHAFWLCWV